MIRLIDAAALHEEARQDCDHKGIVDNAEFDLLCNYLDSAPTVEVERNWISVEERLPEPFEFVIVHYGNGDVREGYILPNSGFIHGNRYDGVTHWMPMPFPPALD